jgi:spore coat protein U-like protein
VLLAAFAVAACLPSGTASAAIDVPATRSSVHPLGGCSVVISSFSFSSYSPLIHTGRFAEGVVSFNCAFGVASIELSSGSSGQFRNRRMMSGSDPRAVLFYNIFLDVNRTQVFGDGTAGSSMYVPGTKVFRGRFPIYGEILDGQTKLPAATYSDTVSITVNLTP